ncbi:hypothetical protein SDC9_114598 [bioreactor metagenome]|uniref:Lipid IV(A) 3-deoxy-D-manno-octulosonic acid transferase n=1 Tax=bioreactor metagenome TaxID=1076179 RepID=A0A645C132_9ZZZZ
MKKVEEAKTNSVIPKKLFANDEIILVAGSTWNKDVDVILEAYAKYKKNNSANLRLIIVPHEPTLKNIEYISNKISNTILLSEILELNNIFSANLTGKIIIVDSIGKLLKLYGIADAAYIGGAFGVGVHSITEPAGYGIPLVTGPNCYNSPDTQELSEQNALTIINNSESLYQWFVRINEKTYCEKYGAIAKNYIESNCGATVKITNKIILDLIKENI